MIKICSNKDFGRDFKESVMLKVLGDEQSDLAVRSRMTCEAAMPIKENKQKVWRQLTGINEQNSNAQVGAFSIEQLSAKIDGVYHGINKKFWSLFLMIILKLSEISASTEHMVTNTPEIS